jgi:octaprenyl-diphosphate synthase
MHDDIVDQSDTRRGRPAAHLIFGIPETLLAADYLLAKAALMSLSYKNLDIMTVMVELLRELSLGELAELKARRQVDLTVSEYLDIIYRKTAVLLEAVGKTAALAAESGPKESTALGQYGRLMGLAFQIVDDVLDYQANSGALGKPVGQDLAEGRITLPFILARDNLPAESKARLLAIAAQNDLNKDLFEEASILVEKGAGIELSLAKATSLANEAIAALEVLPHTTQRDLLTELAIFTVRRDR